MMLAIKAWYWNFVSTDSALLTLLGDVSHIVDDRPSVIEVFPLVILSDEDQRDREYADNKPKAVHHVVKIDIYTKTIAGYPTTTAVGIELARIFDSRFYACIGNRESPEPVPNIRHRIMRFSRDLFPSDLT